MKRCYWSRNVRLETSRKAFFRQKKCSKNHVFGWFSTETGITENNSFISYGGPYLSRVYPQVLSFRLPKYQQNRRVRPDGSEIPILGDYFWMIFWRKKILLRKSNFRCPIAMLGTPPDPQRNFECDFIAQQLRSSSRRRDREKTTNSWLPDRFFIFMSL